MKNKFFLVFLVGFSCLAFAGDKSFWLETEEAVLFELNSSGLKLVANEVKSKSLQNVANARLPNFEDEVDHGIKVTIWDMYYDVNFPSVDIRTHAGKMELDVGVSHVRLRAGTARFEKKVLGIPIRTTCNDIRISIGEQSTIHVNTHIPMVVKDARVKLWAENVSFAISDNNFKVTGPQSCSGPLGIGYLLSKLVNMVLSKQKGTIEGEVKKKIYQSIPQLEQALNREVHRSIPYAIENVPPLPNKSVMLLTSPQSLQITPQGLKFILSLDVSDEEVSLDDLTEESLAWSRNLYGHLGFNPDIFNNALQSLFPNGSEFMEMTKDMAQGIEEVLNVNSASSIWPDLNEANVTGPHLKMFLRLDELPLFELDDVNQGVRVVFPKMHFKFLANIDEKWVEYFHLTITLRTSIIPTVNNHFVWLSMSKDSALNIDGVWAKDYKPTLALFEKDMAEVVFMSIFEYLYSAGPFMKIYITPFSLGGQGLTIENPRVERPFLKIDVVDEP